MPAIEVLESRTLLATILWDGGGDGLNWFDPLNWDTDALPGPADSVVINVGDGQPTVRIGPGATTIADLASHGSLEVEGALTVSDQADMAGALTVSGTVVVQDRWTQAGAMALDGGFLMGAGVMRFADLSIASGSISQLRLVNIQTNSAIVVNGPLLLEAGATVVFSSSVLWSGGTISMDAAEVYIQPGATWTVGPGASLISAGGTGGRIEVRGSLESGTDVRIEAFLPASPTGAIRVLGGTLTLAGRGDFAGVVEVADGSTIRFEEGLLLPGSYVRPGATIVGGGTWEVDHASFSINVAGPFAEIRLSNGADLFAIGGLVVGALHNDSSDIRTSAAVLTLTGASQWTDAWFSGAECVIEAGAEVGGTYAWRGTLRVRGVLAFDGGTSSHPYHSNLTIEAGGRWELAGPGESAPRFGGVVENHGTIRKSGPGNLVFHGYGGFMLGWMISGGLRLENHGLVEVQSGTLALDGGGENDGTITIAAGAVLQIGRMDYDLLPGGIVDGAGTLRFERMRVLPTRFTIAGQVQTDTLIINGQVELHGAGVSVGALRVLGFGDMAIVGDLTHDGPMTWTGHVGAGAGRLILGSASTTTIVQGSVGRPHLDAELRVHGIVNVAARLDLRAAAEFAVESDGRVTSSGAQIVAMEAGAAFTSLGRVTTNGNFFFRNQSGAGAVIALGGDVTIRSGMMHLRWGGTHDADFTMDPGSRLELAGGGGAHAFSGSSSIRGDRFRVLSGLTLVDGALSVDALAVLGGVLNIRSSDASAAAVWLEIGELGMSPQARLTVDVIFEHRSGTLRLDIGEPFQDLPLTITPSAPLRLAPASVLRLRGVGGYQGLAGIWWLVNAPARTGQYGTVQLPAVTPGFFGSLEYGPSLLFHIDLE